MILRLIYIVKLNTKSRFENVPNQPQEAFCITLRKHYKSSSADEIPERDVTYYLIWLLIYHWSTTYLYSAPKFFFWSNAYISNGRSFTKSAFRILLLSTLRVSRINYYLICSLPIHTRSSAHAEGPQAQWQLKSCKILHKCLTDCTWKGLQPVNDLQDHSRALPLLPFNRPYTISY